MRFPFPLALLAVVAVLYASPAALCDRYEIQVESLQCIDLAAPHRVIPNCASPLVAGRSQIQLAFRIRAVNSKTGPRSPKQADIFAFRSNIVRRLAFLQKKLDIHVCPADSRRCKPRWILAKNIKHLFGNHSAEESKRIALKWDIPVDMAGKPKEAARDEDVAVQMFSIRFNAHGALAFGQKWNLNLDPTDPKAKLTFQVQPDTLYRREMVDEKMFARFHEIYHQAVADRQGSKIATTREWMRTSPKISLMEFLPDLLRIHYDKDVMFDTCMVDRQTYTICEQYRLFRSIFLLRRIHYWRESPLFKDERDFRGLEDYFVHRMRYSKEQRELLDERIRKLDREMFDHLFEEPGWVERKRIRWMTQKWNAFLRKHKDDARFEGFPEFKPYTTTTAYFKEHTLLETMILHAKRCADAMNTARRTGPLQEHGAESDELAPALVRRDSRDGIVDLEMQAALQTFRQHEEALSEALPCSAVTKNHSHRRLFKRIVLEHVLILVKMFFMLALIWRVFIRPYDYFFRTPNYWYYHISIQYEAFSEPAPLSTVPELPETTGSELSLPSMHDHEYSI